MKKLIIAVLVLLIVGVAAFLVIENKDDNKNDAIKFKEEYESLNNIKRDGKTIRALDIPKNNPFIYKEASDIVKMINNKETFAVYFGFVDCPWCRSVLPSLIKVSEDLKLDKIYYVDVKEIRDVLKLEEGKVKTEKKGTDDYYKLLDLLSAVLEDYTLTDSEGKTVQTDEKRIYAPNVVAVVNGRAKELTTGISEKQDDAYMKLTDEIENDSYNKFKCVIKCVTDSQNACTVNKAC